MTTEPTKLELKVAKAMCARMVEDFQTVQIPMIREVMAKHGQLGAPIAPEWMRLGLPWEEKSDDDRASYLMQARAAIGVIAAEMTKLDAAAAPPVTAIEMKLLAALKAVMGGQIGGSPDMDAERFQLARAAIAEAEGRTP